MNIEPILAVMNTNELVVEIRPEKNSGLYRIWTYDLCDTGAALWLVSSVGRSLCTAVSQRS